MASNVRGGWRMRACEIGLIGPQQAQGRLPGQGLGIRPSSAPALDEPGQICVPAPTQSAMRVLFPSLT